MVETLASGVPAGLLADAGGEAAELQRIQAERARLAAREADVILGFAADRPEAPEATRFGDELAAVREASKATVDVELISMGGTSPGTKSAVPGLCGHGKPRDRSSRH